MEIDFDSKKEGGVTWKKTKLRIIERGVLKFSEDSRYEHIIMADEFHKLRKYAFRPGECIELDSFTDEFIDIVDFVSSSLMKEMKPGKSKHSRKRLTKSNSYWLGLQ